MFTKLSKSDKEVVNDQAVIRAMSPRDTVKWLARLARIPVRTARFWAEHTVPVYRRADIALLMIEEFHKQTRWREEVLYPALCKMAGVANDVEIIPTSSIANTAADLAGAAADRIEAAIDWIETE
jgi:hypothetical protein